MGWPKGYRDLIWAIQNRSNGYCRGGGGFGRPALEENGGGPFGAAVLLAGEAVDLVAGYGGRRRAAAEREGSTGIPF